jgi:hypothetical protein
MIEVAGCAERIPHDVRCDGSELSLSEGGTP